MVVETVKANIGQHRDPSGTADGLGMLLAEQPGPPGDDNHPAGQIEQVFFHAVTLAIEITFPLLSDSLAASAICKLQAASRKLTREEAPSLTGVEAPAALRKTDD